MRTTLTEEQLRGIVERIVKGVFGRLGLGARTFDNPIARTIISEGLTKTYPSEQTKRWVANYIGYRGELSKLISTTRNAQNDEVMHIMVYPNLEETEDIITNATHAMKSCGWYLSDKSQYAVRGQNMIVLQFEKKFKEDVIPIEKLGRLYHITPESHINKIRQQGLCPRHNNYTFNYPDRIHCFYGYTQPEIMWATAISLEQSNRKGGGKPNNTYYVLTIDTSALNNDVVFYRDDNHEYGVYTYDNIPPMALKIQAKWVLPEKELNDNYDD